MSDETRKMLPERVWIDFATGAVSQGENWDGKRPEYRRADLVIDRAELRERLGRFKGRGDIGYSEVLALLSTEETK